MPDDISRFGRFRILCEKTYFLTCTPNKDSSQLAYPRSLIRVFVVNMKKILHSWLPKCTQGYKIQEYIYERSGVKYKKHICKGALYRMYSPAKESGMYARAYTVWQILFCL